MGKPTSVDWDVVADTQDVKSNCAKEGLIEDDEPRQDTIVPSVVSPTASPVLPVQEQQQITELTQAEILQLKVNSILDRTGAQMLLFSSNGNDTRVVMMRLMELGIYSFKTVLGKYRDVTEVSYLIGAQHLVTLIDSGLIDDEECIMVYSRQKSASVMPEVFLVYNDEGEDGLPLVESIGTLDIIKDDSVVQGLPAWTYDPILSLYFVARKPEVKANEAAS